MADARPLPRATLELEGYDPFGLPVAPLAELTRFQHLTDTERRRIIIRVLCGLVAMEDLREAAESASTTEDGADQPFRRRLPFLGLEVGGAAKVRQWDRLRPTPLLPHLGTATGPGFAASTAVVPTREAS